LGVLVLFYAKCEEQWNRIFSVIHRNNHFKSMSLISSMDSPVISLISLML
jgi:hypothetical protein